jgi:hypothetical protein
MVINYRFSKFTVFNKFGDDNADLDLMVAAPRRISVARLAGSACWLISALASAPARLLSSDVRKLIGRF